MARSTRQSKANRSRAQAAQRAARARRSKIVWGTLLGSMTIVGGLLLAVDKQPAPRVEGLSLPLVAMGAADNFEEKIFMPVASLDRARWKSIVIHHSGSQVGSPTSIEAEHQARNFRGLGHHFIVGNGNGMENGEIHLGRRWTEQLPGAHAGGDKGAWHNQHSISICLVGDGNRRAFTTTQLKQLVRLVSVLCNELKIPRDQVVLHRDIAPTEDPGNLFPEADFQALLRAAP